MTAEQDPLSPPRLWSYRMATPAPSCPHGVSYAQPCYGCGWVCPTCKRSYAPWVRECSYRHEDDLSRRAGAEPGTFGPIPPAPVADAPVTVHGAVIDVPSVMTRPHHVRKMKFGTLWTDVMPGLQCRACELDATDGYVRVEFRLTPEGAGGEAAA